MILSCISDLYHIISVISGDREHFWNWTLLTCEKNVFFEWRVIVRHAVGPWKQLRLRTYLNEMNTETQPQNVDVPGKVQILQHLMWHGRELTGRQILVSFKPWMHHRALGSEKNLVQSMRRTKKGSKVEGWRCIPLRSGWDNRQELEQAFSAFLTGKDQLQLRIRWPGDCGSGKCGIS